MNESDLGGKFGADGKPAAHKIYMHDHRLTATSFDWTLFYAVSVFEIVRPIHTTIPSTIDWWNEMKKLHTNGNDWVECCSDEIFSVEFHENWCKW